MNTTRIPRHEGFPNALIERYLCDEVSDDERQRIERALALDQDLARHIRARRSDKAVFSTQHPYRSLALESRRGRSSARRWGLVLLPAGALATLALILTSVLRPVDDQGIGVRGGLKTALVVKRGDTVFELTAEAHLRTHDLVRIRVEDPAGGWVTALAVDDAGTIIDVTGVHAEGRPAHMARGTLMLPSSFEVGDDVSRIDVFVTLSPSAAAARDATQQLIGALRRGGDPHEVAGTQSRRSHWRLWVDTP